MVGVFDTFLTRSLARVKDFQLRELSWFIAPFYGPLRTPPRVKNELSSFLYLLFPISSIEAQYTGTYFATQEFYQHAIGDGT